MRHLRRVARVTLALPFRLLPNVIRRRLLQAIFDAVAAQAPKTAMRWLMLADSDLTVVVNEAAMRYGEGVHVKHRLMRYHDFFVDRIRTGETVLDVGCGYGAVAYSIATRSGARVTGIDLELANVEMARRRFRHANLAFELGDALVALPDERYDVVVLSNVLEHIDDRVGFVRRLVARTRPSRILIRVPMFDRDWRVPLRHELGLYPYSDLGHFTEYTTGSFRDEMAAAGVEITELLVNWGEIWADTTSPAGNRPAPSQ